MRVIYFTNHLRGPKGSAGARSWHQVIALQKKFYIDVFLPSIDPVTEANIYPEQYEGIDYAKVNIHAIYCGKLNRSSKINRLIFFIRFAFAAFLKSFYIKNVICISTMSLPLTLLAAAVSAAKLRKIPVIVDVRDIPFDVARDTGYIQPIWFNNMLLQIEASLLRKCDMISIVSPRYEEFLIGKGVSKHYINYLPIGFDDFEVFESEKCGSRYLKQQFGARKLDVLFLYSGTLGYVNDIEPILSLAELFKNADHIGFVVAGDGQRIEYWKRESKRRGVNVKFVGRVTKQDVAAICKGVDICLHTSGYGSALNSILGNKIFDYMGAGKVVLHFGPQCAVSDLIEAEKCGVSVINGDIDELYVKARQLCDDPNLRSIYGSAGLRAVRAKYLAQQSADGYSELITRFEQIRN
jgi:glycosyltransferase involved in cell wall biosynthesis